MMETAVSIVKCSSLTYRHIKSAIRKALDLIGGMKATPKFYNSGQFWLYVF